MNFLGVKDGKCSKLLEGKDQRTIEDDIKSFLVYIRQDMGISYQSASHYLDAIRKFYYFNTEYDFRWKMIKMYLGEDDDVGQLQQNLEGGIEEDRPYTRQEIHTMLKSANDIRVGIMILLIASSGMRMGAIPLLKSNNLTKIDKLGLYQISVYEGSKKSNYSTFCTPECTNLIDSYLNYRKHAGEELNGSSPLIREQFNPKDKFKVNNSRHIKTGLINYLINEVVVK